MTAKTAIAKAPLPGELPKEATSKADCSRPHGQATHSMPAPRHLPIPEGQRLGAATL